MMNPYLQYMYSYPHKTAYGPLEGIFLADYANELAGPGHSLYLHIPFCETKCGYCNLFSVTGQGRGAVDRYLDAVERQLTQYEQVLTLCQTEFSDFTIGGGTPLLLEEDQLDRVFAMAGHHLSFQGNPEIVVETAPNQTTRGKLKQLKEARVTRISMGVQSFSDRELQTLWRHHGAKKVREALELLKFYEFSCVNLDFIYGIPGQTIGSLLCSLKEALKYEPDELFLYPLYVKHGAGLKKGVSGELVLNPELAFRQYQEASGFLRSQGFRQDSMRRFVRQGKRPVSDCGFSDSLALGCGGRSYLGRLHFCTPYAITQTGCLEQIGKFENTRDFTAVDYGIFLSGEEEKRRYVIRHLFIFPGLDMEQYERKFGFPALEDFPLLGEWLEEGFVFVDYPDREGTPRAFLSLTETGLGLSDYLGPQLISADIRAKMDEWEAIHEQTYDSLSGRFEKL